MQNPQNNPDRRHNADHFLLAMLSLDTKLRRNLFVIFPVIQVTNKHTDKQMTDSNRPKGIIFFFGGGIKAVVARLYLRV